MLTDLATEAACALAILLAVNCCCALRSALLQLSVTLHSMHVVKAFSAVAVAALLRSVLLQLSDKVQDSILLHVPCVCVLANVAVVMLCRTMISSSTRLRVFLVCFPSSCGDNVQDNDIREYKHQLKAERRARKAAESWLRSELKSRVCSPHCFNMTIVTMAMLGLLSSTMCFDAISVLRIMYSIKLHLMS